MLVEIGNIFTPLRDFENAGSFYVTGLTYTVRTPVLAQLAEQWLSEGKIEISGSAARVGGVGTVS